MLQFICCGFLFNVNKGFHGAAEVMPVVLQQNSSSQGKNSILHLHSIPSAVLYETQSRPKYFAARKRHLRIHCEVLCKTRSRQDLSVWRHTLKLLVRILKHPWSSYDVTVVHVQGILCFPVRCVNLLCIRKLRPFKRFYMQIHSSTAP